MGTAQPEAFPGADEINLLILLEGRYLCRGGTRVRMLKHKEVKYSSVPPLLCELVCIKTPVWQICCRSLPSISSSSFMISFVGGLEATDEL